eukprot:s293_g28.t1
MYLYAARAFVSARRHVFEAMPALPTDTVEKVDKILNDEHLPVLAKVSQLFTFLADNGLGYYQTAAPKDTLTHPANRGGSLLSSTDVWSKGLRMLSSGVQPAMLQSGAVCFELSNVKEKRESQIAGNKSLVEGSNNSLAPVAGQERFLTVATSHTAAFCKADQAPADKNSDLGVKDAMTDALFEGAFVVFNSLLNLTKSPSKSGSVQALPAAYTEDCHFHQGKFHANANALLLNFTLCMAFLALLVSMKVKAMSQCQPAIFNYQVLFLEGVWLALMTLIATS